MTVVRSTVPPPPTRVPNSAAVSDGYPAACATTQQCVCQWVQRDREMRPRLVILDKSSTGPDVGIVALVPIDAATFVSALPRQNKENGSR